MSLRRELLTVARDLCARAAQRLSAILAQPSDPEPRVNDRQLEAEQQAAARLRQEARRRGFRPWNYSRPRVEQPSLEELQYLRDTRGERATVEVLLNFAKKDR